MAYHLIRKLEHFTRLTPEDKAALEEASRAKVRRLAPDEELIGEGEAPRVVHLVLEGWAYRYKTMEDGRRQIVSYLIPGDLCDLNIYILSQIDHSIAAFTPLRVAEFTREAFQELAETRPRVTTAFWWESLVTAAIQREWTVSLGQRTAYERLAHLFCELYVRLRVVGLADGNRYEIPLTQTELADTVGLSAVHVNRTLQELRGDGLITLRDQELTITDLPALKRVAKFNPSYLHLSRDPELLVS
jgi:CRP-like cAMP-binding protein